eukprot:COSAG01_NODE_903_length_12848_cov_7.966899_10_plen_249_part_00
MLRRRLQPVRRLLTIVRLGHRPRPGDQGPSRVDGLRRRGSARGAGAARRARGRRQPLPALSTQLQPARACAGRPQSRGTLRYNRNASNVLRAWRTTCISLVALLRSAFLRATSLASQPLSDRAYLPPGRALSWGQKVSIFCHRHPWLPAPAPMWPRNRHPVFLLTCEASSSYTPLVFTSRWSLAAATIFGLHPLPYLGLGGGNKQTPLARQLFSSSPSPISVYIRGGENWGWASWAFRELVHNVGRRP